MYGPSPPKFPYKQWDMVPIEAADHWVTACYYQLFQKNLETLLSSVICGFITGVTTHNCPASLPGHALSICEWQQSQNLFFSSFPLITSSVTQHVIR